MTPHTPNPEPSQQPASPGTPQRPHLVTDDLRLSRTLRHETLAENLASLNEYAHSTGLDVANIVEMLSHLLDTRTLTLEVQGDEVFLLPAPTGRPQPETQPEVAENLWERLRRTNSPDHAYQLWRTCRALETAGWNVETRQSRITFGLGPLDIRPQLGVWVGHHVIPLLLTPTPSTIASPAGSLSDYARVGANAVGIVCEQGALEELTTATRRWVLAHPVSPTMSVLLLEAPRFNPTLITPADAAITPRSVAYSTLAAELDGQQR